MLLQRPRMPLQRHRTLPQRRRRMLPRRRHQTPLRRRVAAPEGRPRRRLARLRWCVTPRQPSPHRSRPWHRAPRP
jgi:hypothetical protein